MAELVWKNAFLLAGGRNFACQYNQASFALSRDLLERTALCDTHRKRVAGLRDGTFNLTGFWAQSSASTAAYTSTGTPDPGFNFDSLAFSFVNALTSGWIYCFGPSKTTGEVGWFGAGMHGSYSIEGAHGELLRARLSGQTDGAMVRGPIMYSKYTAAASTNGPGYSFGALASGYTLQLGGFVLGSTGGTLTVDWVSSTSHTSFAAGTTRATQVFTSTGADIVTLTGPITDTGWRVQLAGAGGPSFNALFVMGAVKD